MENYNYEECPQGLVSLQNERNVNYDFLKYLISDLLETKKKIRVLEIGTGGARNLCILNQLFPNKLQLFGTDISNVAISYANSLNIGQFRLASSEIIPFKEKFDLIIIIDLLEHLKSEKEVKATLKTAQNKLNTSGKIYISAPIELNRYSLTWVFSKFDTTKNWTRLVFGHIIQFEPKSLKRLLDPDTSIIREFYSVHALNQIQVLFFLFLPKILLENFFGKKQATELRDSNELLSNNGSFFLRSMKKIILSFSKPLAYLGYHESYYRRHSKFGAGNIHFLIERK